MHVYADILCTFMLICYAAMYVPSTLFVARHDNKTFAFPIC